MSSFEREYWETNYAQPEAMEGISNAAEHARYLKSFFEVENLRIETMVDLGYGLGFQMREMLYLFSPSHAWGIEPSAYARKKAAELSYDPYGRIDLQLSDESLSTWATGDLPNNDVIDLGVCMSVLQYIPDEDMDAIIEGMARRLKFLYLTVPTDVELGRQVDELEFKDSWAIHRSRNWYQAAFAPHFSFVGSRILESKRYFDEENTLCTDLLYRW